jgi:hypothetical protein
LRATERLAAVSVVISSLELLARQPVLADGHLMSWQVGQLSALRRVKGRRGRAIDSVMSIRPFRGLLVARAAAAALLALRAPGRASGTALRATVAVTSIAMFKRTPFGWDGADQMSATTFVGLSLWSAFPRLERVVVRFFALQLVLCYLTSGVAKAISPEWRSGNALIGIAGTKMYGNAALHRWLTSVPGLSTLLCWGVIVGECTFGLSLIVPRPVRRLMLACGVAFHAIIAGEMRLNTFFWSFTAAYPALEAYADASTTRR